MYPKPNSTGGSDGGRSEKNNGENVRSLWSVVCLAQHYSGRSAGLRLSVSLRKTPLTLR